jgi:hypothetical protein
MILKFWKTDNGLVLKDDSAEMIDITSDFRTKFLNKTELTSEKYRVDSNTFFIAQPLFIKLAKVKNRQSIEALYITHSNNNIIIVGKNAYVFYNGQSININEYNPPISEKDIQTYSS